MIVLAGRNEPSTLINAIRAALAGQDDIIESPSLGFDYLIPGRVAVGIERKTAPDLLNSIADGRLHSECAAMVKACDVRLLVCVTPWIVRENIVYVNGRATQWSAISLQMQLVSLAAAGISYIYVEQSDLPAFIAALSVWSQKERHLCPRRPKLAFEELDRRLAFLAGIPGLGPRRANDILNAFGTIANALENLDKWNEVRGIGEKIVENTRRFLNE